MTEIEGVVGVLGWAEVWPSLIMAVVILGIFSVIASWLDKN